MFVSHPGFVYSFHYKGVSKNLKGHQYLVMVGLVVAILVVGVVLADKGKYLIPNENSPD